MANKLTIQMARESLEDCYGYEVRVSAAQMPNSCWGRYVHVALMCVLNGHTVSQIRHTKSQLVIDRAERLFDGSSDRCARAVAERHMWAQADEMNERMHSNRHTRQMRVHAESMVSRSGEEV